MVVYTPDEISVNRGSSFSVICSTVSKYPGGYFYLARSNKNISEAQPAYGHSIFYRATFDFPAIEYKHQGAYTCIFGVNISSTPFCSDPSKSLQVIVAGENFEEHCAFVVVISYSHYNVFLYFCHPTQRSFGPCSHLCYFATFGSFDSTGGAATRHDYRIFCVEKEKPGHR